MKKGKNGVKKDKYWRAKRAKRRSWEGERAATSRLASLANFFPFSPNEEPSPKLLPAVSSFNPGHFFFLFFCSRQSNFSTNSPGDACYAAEKLMVRRNPHYHFQKYMKMLPVIVFSIWLTSLRTRLLNLFSSKHFAVEDYYPITLSCCC